MYMFIESYEKFTTVCGEVNLWLYNESDDITDELTFYCSFNNDYK